MSVSDPEGGTPRSVSVIAEGARGAALRDAIVADRALRLLAVASRFTDLVVEESFPGDVVVLAEEPGRALFAHAQTAAAAGAVVLVQADVELEQLESLEDAGAFVLPLSATPAAVAERIVTLRPARRRVAHPQSDDVRRRPRLSSGERRALAHYVQGRTTVQVAAEMGVGYETAKTFLRRARAKYAAVDRPAGTRAQLVLRAQEDGIL